MIRGFDAVAGPLSKVLILGTLPGGESLARGQYYANPQNVFWHIADRLFGVDAHLDYADRLTHLKEAGVAIWDVLAAGEREGSLDSRIVRDSAVANDFTSFLAEHPGICHVYFNGSKAKSLFHRLVRPSLQLHSSVGYTRLPSTSPANTHLDREGKVAAWRIVLDELTAIQAESADRAHGQVALGASVREPCS